MNPFKRGTGILPVEKPPFPREIARWITGKMPVPRDFASACANAACAAARKVEHIGNGRAELRVRFQ
jgi:hypothetical protein